MGIMFPMMPSNEIPGVCEESGSNNWRNALLYINTAECDGFSIFVLIQTRTEAEL